MTDSRPLWLDTAFRIGTRIADEATWDGDRCTWNVVVSARIPGKLSSRIATSGGELYQGTAGIGLFLTELYRQTRDDNILVTAQGALRNSIAILSRMPATAFGFHSGRVGIAYACYRHGRITGTSDWIAAATEALAPLVGNAPHSPTTDVIGGAAGAIPVLLQMSDHLPREVTTDLALAAGNKILSDARFGHEGWSWNSKARSVRNLTGFAHGVSGYVHALLELFNATGDAWFRYGAEQALAYERRYFNRAVRNWPDFRYLPLAEYILYGQVERLRTALRAGHGMPPYTETHMSAWCHGAPGICFALLRAIAVLGEDPHREYAVAAAETTLESLSKTGGSYCLCHGYFGNCEVLLSASRILNRPDLRSAVESCALTGRSEFELTQTPWPSGAIAGGKDPSLLIGDAGVGYFYLQLHDPTTPSVLCPTPLPVPRARVEPSRHADDLRQIQLNAHFGATLASIGQRFPDEVNILVNAMPDPGLSEVEGIYAAIRTRIESEQDPDVRAELTDAFAVDETRFQLTRSAPNFTDETVRDLIRPAPSDIVWSEAAFTLGPNTHLVRTRKNWSVGSPEAEFGATALTDEMTTVVFWRETAVRANPLTPFASLVLESLDTPKTVSQIIERLATRTEGVDRLSLEEAVLQQIKMAYVSGIVECVGPYGLSEVVTTSDTRKGWIDDSKSVSTAAGLNHHRQTPSDSINR